MQPTTTTTNGSQPWQERQVGYGLKRTGAVPYADVRDLAVTVGRVSFSCQGEQPNRVALAASQVGGERLYRELAQRFPAALVGWQG